MSSPRRAIVIGSGHNGLVCAIRLAGSGHHVTVLEGAARPGGAVRSSEDTLPGFVHDTCSAFFPLTAASPAFRELSLGLDWVSPETPMAHLLGEGRAIVLHRDLAATAQSLDRAAPGAGTAWQSFVSRLWPHREKLFRAALSPFPPVAAGAALAAGLRLHSIELARMLLGSAAGAGRKLFGDDLAAAWLAGSAAHSDLPPDGVPSAAFGLILHLLGHAVGWPFPRGGAGRLTEALLARLEQLGGELRCSAPAERIDLRSGRVAAVGLAGGERLDADAVVAAVSPRPLLRMLPPRALPGRLTRRLEGWRYGLGTLKIDYALGGPVPWGAVPARAAGVVHIGGSLDELVLAHRQAAAGGMPDRPTLVVGQQSLHDATRAPEGRHTLYVYSRVPQRPGLDDDGLAERVEARIEQLAPGFRELVLDRVVRTPAALERDNPSLGGGDLAAGSLALDQQLVFRPSPRMFRYRTPLRGLYVAGASVHPGPGVHGTSGRGAADALLADLSPARFWHRA
jgi:phytoene dehydrogenase-like protein